MEEWRGPGTPGGRAEEQEVPHMEERAVLCGRH